MAPRILVAVVVATVQATAVEDPSLSERLGSYMAAGLRTVAEELAPRPITVAEQVTTTMTTTVSHKAKYGSHTAVAHTEPKHVSKAQVAPDPQAHGWNDQHSLNHAEKTAAPVVPRNLLSNKKAKATTAVKSVPLSAQDEADAVDVVPVTHTADKKSNQPAKPTKSVSQTKTVDAAVVPQTLLSHKKGNYGSEKKNVKHGIIESNWDHADKYRNMPANYAKVAHAVSAEDVLRPDMAMEFNPERPDAKHGIWDFDSNDDGFATPSGPDPVVVPIGLMAKNTTMAKNVSAKH